MALEEAKEYLVSQGYGDRIRIFDVSSATVELAAEAVYVPLESRKAWKFTWTSP
jgi:hypothetical protein